MVTDLVSDRAESVAAEIIAAGGSAVAQVCNVADIDALERVRDRTLEEFGQIDIVMNNVGVIALGPPRRFLTGVGAGDRRQSAEFRAE